MNRVSQYRRFYNIRGSGSTAKPLIYLSRIYGRDICLSECDSIASDIVLADAVPIGSQLGLFRVSDPAHFVSGIGSPIVLNSTVTSTSGTQAFIQEELVLRIKVPPIRLLSPELILAFVTGSREA